MRETVRELDRLARTPGEAGVFASWVDKAELAKLHNWVTKFEGQRVLRHAHEWEIIHLTGTLNEPAPRSFVYASDFLEHGPLYRHRKGVRR